MVPPLPSERIVTGPVTVAEISSRLSNCALFAVKARLSRVLPPEKVTEPRPSIEPPSPVAPDSLVNRSCGPEKRASTLSPLITIPVTALSSRAFWARMDPRICGSVARPPMSAPIETGPDRSKISLPVNRHKVSAEPA